jgi:hypothetical protein
MVGIEKAGATPNLLKYKVTADQEGGDVTLDRETLLKDTARGPLRNFIERAIKLDGDEEACQRLLCNPSTRVFVTPRRFARLAVDAVADENSALALRVFAEPDAMGIIALEFRHSVAA